MASTALLFDLFGVESALEFDATLSETHSSAATPTDHAVEEGASVTDHVQAELERVSLEGIISNTPLTDMSVSRFLGASGAPRKRVAALRGAPTQTEWRVTHPLQGGPGKLVGGYSNSTGPLPLIGRLSPPPYLQKSNPGRFEPGRPEQLVSETIVGSPVQFDQTVDRVAEVYRVLQFLVTSGVKVTLVTDLREYPSMLVTRLNVPRTTPHAQVFGIELQQLLTVSSRQTTVTVSKAKPAESRAEETVSAGPTVAWSPTLPQEERARAVLVRTSEATANAAGI